MKTTRNVQHLIAGITGAMSASFGILMCLAFGFTFGDFVVTWLTYIALVPIVLGGSVGILVARSMNAIRPLWTFCLAAVSMAAGEFLGAYIVYILDFSMETTLFRLSTLLARFAMGVTVELLLFGLMFVLHNLTDKDRTET